MSEARTGTGRTGETGPRILIYCHNVHGLGHVVRSLRVAAALRPGERCRVRLITGCRFLDRLDVDPRLEVVRLPALVAEEGGRVAAIDGTPLGETLTRRGELIRRQLIEFQPAVVLVDHNPLGLVGELRPALAEARQQKLPPRFVWGVRDFFAAAGYVDRMLAYSGGPEAMRRAVGEYHGAIAYADGEWLDAFAGYGDLPLPQHRAAVGFVAGPVPRPAPTEPPRVVALSGGGAQAGQLAALLLAALAEPLAAGRLALRLVVGPFSPTAPIEALSSGRRGVEIWADGALEQAIADAALVVARVGYNTAYTLLRSPLPVVLLPIRAANGEQDLRASRLAELEGVWTVPADTKKSRDDDGRHETEAELAAVIAAGLARGPRRRPLPFALDGAEGAARWLLRAAEETS